MRILIIGASGELGGALAKFYAAAGCTLCLWGQRTERLADLNRECRAAGAGAIITRSLDLNNIEAAIAAVAGDDDRTPFDLAIIASGLGDIREKRCPC